MGNKVCILVGDAKQLLAALEKRVKITGEMTGNKIAVPSHPSLWFAKVVHSPDSEEVLRPPETTMRTHPILVGLVIST